MNTQLLGTALARVSRRRTLETWVLVTGLMLGVLGVAYAETYTWTGGAGPLTDGKWAGYHSWSDAGNWGGNGVPPAGTAGGENCNRLDFSKAAANTKVVVDNNVQMHLGNMMFAANQGTLQIVPTDVSSSNLRTFSACTISVPAGTRVEFGLNCVVNNDFSNAQIDIVGGGTFAITAPGTFSANRWRFFVGEGTTLALSSASADLNTAMIGFTSASSRLSLECDSSVGSLCFPENANGKHGVIDLNGHTLTLSGGNHALAANNFNRLCDITGTGALIVSGGNVSTNKIEETFAGPLTIENADIVSEAAYTGVTELHVDGSGHFTVAESQTVNSLSGVGTTGGVAIEQGKTLTVNGSADTEYAASLSGDGSFVKAGAGTLTLSGANSLAGETKVESGTLKVVGQEAETDGEHQAHLFTFDNVSDGVFQDAGYAKAKAAFRYGTSTGADTETPETGAAQSQICEGRRSSNGVRLFAGSRASVYVTSPGTFANGIATGKGPFTMTAWMKLDESGCRSVAHNYGTHAIFYLGTGSQTELSSFKVYLCDGTNLNFSAGGYLAGKASEKYPDKGFTVPLTAAQLFDGGWHMLSVTYSGEETRTITGYYDGARIGELALAEGAEVNLNGRCHLGWGGMGSIAGDFDDWSLVTRCESEEEIASAYFGLLRSCAEGTDAFMALPSAVAHWAFDDAEKPGRDSSENGYHLTADANIRTGTPIVSVEGASGKALAASNAYVWAGSAWPEKIPSGNAAWTLSIRCALSEIIEGSAYTEPCAFYFGEVRNLEFGNFTENQNRFLLVQYDNANYRANRLALHWNAPAYKAPNFILPGETYQPRFTPANWVHLMVVHTPGVGFAVYRDGILVQNVANGAVNLTPKELFVGLRPPIGSESRGHPYFPGYIDDVAIWDSAFTSQQVHAYTAGLAKGQAGTPLSANSDVTVAAEATLELAGTRIVAKSLNGQGTVRLCENAAVTIKGGNISGALSGSGQVATSGRLAISDASGYYGNIRLLDGGSVVAENLTAAVAIPEGYEATIAADGTGLPIVSSAGLVALPKSAKLVISGEIKGKTSYVIAQGAALRSPESFDGWEIVSPRFGTASLSVKGNRLVLRLSPCGTLLLIR